MIDKKFIEELKESYETNQEERYQIIEASNKILHDAKRVIFAIHRQEMGEAERSLKDIEGRIIGLVNKFGYERLNEEGSYNAGVEEYAEAKTFYMVSRGEPIKQFKGIRLSVASYLGGLCDLTGELVRQAVNAAAAGDTEKVAKNKKVIEDILNSLVEFDMTGYLRNKYDQARHSLKKIEHINYEISLKKQ